MTDKRKRKEYKDSSRVEERDRQCWREKQKMDLFIIGAYPFLSDTDSRRYYSS
jgi:hypothetical protein